MLEPNKPIIISNFLTEKIIYEIKQHQTNDKKPHNDDITYRHSISIKNIDLIEDIKKIVIGNIPEIKDDYDFDIRYTIVTNSSYLKWHDDHYFNYAITVYLNNTWNMDWFGFFIFKDNDSNFYKAYLPQYNTALIFKPPMIHCVVPPNIGSPKRETLQIFIKKSN